MITMRDIYLKYDEEEILKGVSFDVRPGEFVLLTGRSGCGKSSLLKLVNGLIPHFDKAVVTGTVQIHGMNPAEEKLYMISRHVASVFQNPKTAFFNTDTRAELLFYPENRGFSKERMGILLAETLSLFNIGHLMHRSIFELSGGEKQILAIAGAYMTGNPIIVMDEPSANLDDVYTDKVREMLRILKEQGRTVLIAEHRFHYLKDLIDTVYLIEDGQFSGKYTGEEFSTFDDEKMHGFGLRGMCRPELRVSDDFGGRDYVIEEMMMDFPHGGHRIRLDNLGFNCGEIIGVTGRNGIGKTTLMRALIGQTKRTTGRVRCRDGYLGKKERTRRSFCVMQDVNAELFTESVWTETALGTNRTETERSKMLTRLDLAAMQTRHPMSLSGGQKQRLVVGCAALTRRPVLFFDEPSSGMDYANMLKTANRIRDLRQYGCILFIVSHDRDLLRLTADKILNLTAFEHPLPGKV
ncbi:MAG: ABC transporter ATP-binding protein [Eubacteriales bacterium]|nr:ABC transporter ATP-binding protein [Eubacteriales bacterium]